MRVDIRSSNTYHVTYMEINLWLKILLFIFIYIYIFNKDYNIDTYLIYLNNVDTHLNY